MTVTTTSARVMLASDLASKYSTVYFGVGQSEIWNSKDTAPLEDVNSKAIPNPLAYIRVGDATLCRPLLPNEATPANPITFNTKTYVRVSSKDAYTQQATCVYFEAKVNKDALTSADSFTFRSSGLYIGVTPKSGVTKPVLLPAEITSAGVLFSYSNGSPRVLDDETSIRLGAVYTLAPFEA